MINTCPRCGKEKDSVGPKVVGKTKSKDRRSLPSDDALITKVMCQDCYNSSRASDKFTQET